ncbi:MAG: hypothetical protein GXZ05_12855 [Gammaproteobacteria bacterium]|nr:hypothetical protein [Gammaproteobacteria bacterium]
MPSQHPCPHCGTRLTLDQAHQNEQRRLLDWLERSGRTLHTGEFVKLETAAAYLECSAKTLHNRRTADGLPMRRISGHWVLSVHVIAWLSLGKRLPEFPEYRQP